MSDTAFAYGLNVKDFRELYNDAIAEERFHNERTIPNHIKCEHHQNMSKQCRIFQNQILEYCESIGIDREEVTGKISVKQ
jgi:ADP-dependent phosphofructokinase/glucokinase